MIGPAEIAAALGLARREGRGWRCLCPAHTDRSPSLSLDESASGRLLVKCWSGCNSVDILREINKLTGRSVHIYEQLPPHTSVKSRSTPKWVERLWRDASALRHDDLAATYLRSRGLRLEQFPKSLRFHPQCRVSGLLKIEFLPALLARFDYPNGDFSTCHRIYLAEPGTKADIDRPKRICSSPARGGAIRLAPASDQLGIAEGIETALACMITTGVPVWAAYSSSLLPSVAVPSDVKQVIIFADNDCSGAGQIAACKLADRLLKEGKAIKMLIPPIAGRDWLDLYCEDNSRVEQQYTEGAGSSASY